VTRDLLLQEMDSGAEGNQSLLLLAEMACRQAPIRGREKLEVCASALYPLPFHMGSL
jgi:hypothetical protein